ncbi:MAG: fibronectin type III domain-containing protein [Thermoplasmata archaeon]|nr:MAG: fibronectin type III domain-containing protein [Thermoplasmata archaeon]
MLVMIGRTQWTKSLVIPVAVLVISITLSTFMLSIPNEGEPVGEEFQVNTYTTSYQTRPSVAMDPEGNFIIAWNSYQQDGNNWGVFAQRYDSNGNPLGGDFQVNTYTAGGQAAPSVAINSTGHFVIAWSGSGTGDGGGIFAQRYNSSGDPQGGEFRVNTYTTDNQRLASAAMDSNGNFVIAWESNLQDGSEEGIYAQLYNKDGNPIGTEIQVNTYTANDQEYPSAAMDANGNFVITWHSVEQDGSSYGIYAQCYDSGGIPIKGEFRVNSFTSSYQYYPSVARNSLGDFVIVWAGVGSGGGSYENVYAQRYNDIGEPVGGEFKVNTYTTNRQHFPSVAIDSNSNFVIAWESEGQDGSGYGIYAQRFDNSGNPLDVEFRVNSHKTNDQRAPSTGMDPNGNFVIAWQSKNQDGSEEGIFAQRYDNRTLCRIFDIQVLDRTDTTAIITWKSNIRANSTIEYGFSPAYGSTIHNSSFVTTHSMKLDGLEPGRLYHFRVASYNNSTNYNISIDFVFTTKFAIDLELGWNMISLPLNQTDTNLGKVLENISGDYDAVQWFDITDFVDPWKHNHISKPTSLNDLTDIDKRMGLWIHITNPLGTTLYVPGTAPEIGYINQITLHNGWNLVGYPSLIERAPDSSDLPAEVDMVMWYNASSGLWESWDPGSYSLDNLNLLKPGQGLWIHYTGATDVWSLEYVN